ncbi:MAG: SigF/SigG family RNA polymerase sporulation sigma factor [Lachnospiraceae bacterium]|nr:SigF/SigG family RNA polymerase sporulation sigma factor [Lachnospiraceae bacterium]
MDRTLELIKFAKEGDQDAKEQIVTSNLGLVWAVARRFLGRGHDLEDLYQIGCIGLMKCIDKFDLSYDVKFSTYAVPMISGEIKRFLRDDGIVKVSRTLKETAYKVKKMREEIVNRTGVEPKLEEISSLLQIDMEEIVASLEANVEVESIHKTIYENDGNAIYLIDKIVSEEDEKEEVINHMLIEELMRDLNDEERQLIQMRYYENKTQTEIANVIGVSQVQVSRMEKRILLKMRQQI